MTTIKVLPKDEQHSSTLKVVLLLVVVLGAAFLLFKHDPYTAAMLDKHMLNKKVGSSSSRLRQQGNTESILTQTVPPVAAVTGAVPAGAATGGVMGRTFTMSISGLKDGKEGKIVIKTHPEWSPLGAARFHELMDMGFYNDVRIFRVVNNFMVQFGIQGTPNKYPIARQAIQDDPVKTTNAYGTITFATSGKNARTTQIFINTNKQGNKFLDPQGFSPFAEVVSGIEYVEQIYSAYGEKPNQGKIQNQGNKYLAEEFPLLSYIASARAIGGDKP